MSKSRPRKLLRHPWSSVVKLAATVALASFAFVMGGALSNDVKAYSHWTSPVYISEVHPVVDADGSPMERVE